MREKVDAAGGRMRGFSDHQLQAALRFAVEVVVRPLIRQASPATFSRRGRRGGVVVDEGLTAGRGWL